ncbi:MAG: M2 family metallopeptidase [Myxococcota bacterium]
MVRTTSALLALGLGCATAGPATESASPPETSASTPKTPTAADAQAFVQKLDGELQALWTDWARAEWVKATYIIHDTEILAAKAHEKVLAYMTDAIRTAATFDGLELDPDTRRQLHLLKISQSLPPPADPAKRARVAAISAEMESIYGKGKVCREGACKELGELSKVLATSRDYETLLQAWEGWRTISRPMMPLYSEFVALANEGARDIGFDDMGELWRAGYDMEPDQFGREVERLWNEVAPLYEALHCHVRAKLLERYGPDRVDSRGLIPAHLLGNMWAQEWGNIYPLVEPYPGASDLDVTRALEENDWDAIRMVKLGESFFTSLGLDALPGTFYERSLFTKPKDRDVVCHASAWDVDYNNDLRIKMCITPTEEDLITIHHELGHNYYFRYYNHLPVLYQGGAHDGFHEGIGDTLALSVTPGYLQRVGLLEEIARSDKALINLQMKEALDKIAFLPFGKLIDDWRWQVFSGRVTPEAYNKAWWKLRARYQGIGPPVERSEEDFDPGAKYHVPANVPYTRYFLARILQFQFHEALCKSAGHDGPLYECSIFGSTEAGDRLKAMLSLGVSRPWPEALEAITGQQEMDGSALVAYFQPLLTWLEEQNQGRTCGWSTPEPTATGVAAP